MNVTIQPKTAPPSGSDSVNASTTRGPAPQGFLSTLSDAASKLDAAHATPQTGTKDPRDRKSHEQAKSDASDGSTDSAPALVPPPVLLPIPTPIPVTVSGLATQTALPSSPPTDAGMASALSALSSTAGSQAISLPSPSFDVNDNVSPASVQPEDGRPAVMALFPSTATVALSGNDDGTIPAASPTDQHEAALQAAIAVASQAGVPQDGNVAKDVSAPLRTVAEAPKATDSLSAASTDAVQAGLQPATRAASVPLTATPVNAMSPSKSTKGLSPVRAASSTVTDKTTGVQGSTATDEHRKISVAKDTKETSIEDTSTTGLDDPQSKSQVQSNLADPGAVQDVVVTPHAAEAPTAALSQTVLSTSPADTSAAPTGSQQATLAPPAHVAQPESVATPMVSSARLIQSIQQSDMRVGINSSQFGAISIHTSSSQGVISSEITLGHTELAKAINAHLAAMQDQPGPIQALSVRVDTSSSNGAGSGGLSQESQDRREQYNGASRPSGSSSTVSQPRAEQMLPVAARSQGALDGRLDIRI